ncbi:hypothetical protein [Amnibacterium sp.]|uniref:hypothetical protein n=1 Tax=Amnibacterium sp. TaxID=1872496 RepID=UPI003F7C53FB
MPTWRTIRYSRPSIGPVVVSGSRRVAVAMALRTLATATSTGTAPGAPPTAVPCAGAASASRSPTTRTPLSRMVPTNPADSSLAQSAAQAGRVSRSSSGGGTRSRTTLPIAASPT